MAWTASPLPPVDDPTAPPVSPPPPQDPTTLPAGPGVPSLATVPPPASAVYGSEIQLSDGSTVAIPPGTKSTAIPRLAAQSEALLFQYYTQQAKEQNAPVTAGSKVYSATRDYGNHPMGQAMAFADHRLGGNWVNANVLDPVNRATGGAPDALLGAGLRAGTSALTWEYDLPASAINVAKHYAAPDKGTSGDLPIASEAIRKQLSIPELPADAGPLQRIGEGALSLALGGPRGSLRPSAIPRAVVAATGAEAGSELGGAYGGEAGSFLGGLAGGGLVPAAARLSAERLVAHAMRSPDAPEIYAAAKRLDPQFEPSFRALANPTGQRVASTMGALPIVGGPIERSNEATSAAIEAARDRVAADLAGQRGLPYGGATPETIGEEVIRGGRQAIAGGPAALGPPGARLPDLRGQRDAAFDPINQEMRGRSVNIGPVLGDMERGFQAEPTLPRFVQATRNAAHEMASQAPGHPASNIQGPVRPGEVPVPWSVAKDFRTAQKQQLGTGDIQVPENRLIALRRGTGDMMEIAANAARPGLGEAYRQANQIYASRIKPMLDRLYGIVGRPMGEGEFTPPPRGEAGAAREITSNLNSPSNIEPYTRASNFPPESWSNIAGQIVSRLGLSGQGTFRPEHFHRDWTQIGQAVRDYLTQGATGGPLRAGQTLEDAATLARNFSTPLSRHGLTGALGSAYGVHQGIEAAKRVGEAVGGGVGKVLLPAWAVLGGARTLESPSMKRAMARQPLIPELVNGVYSRLPAVNAIEQQQEQERLRRSPAARAAGYGQAY